MRTGLSPLRSDVDQLLQLLPHHGISLHRQELPYVDLVPFQFCTRNSCYAGTMVSCTSSSPDQFQWVCGRIPAGCMHKNASDPLREAYEQVARPRARPRADIAMTIPHLLHRHVPWLPCPAAIVNSRILRGTSQEFAFRLCCHPLSGIVVNFVSGYPGIQSIL